MLFFFFSSRRRHTRFKCDWSSDVCSSDLPMGKLFFHLSAAFAQYERDLIQERTRAGLVAARARGRFGGRPRLAATDNPKLVIRAQKLHARQELTIKEICKTLNISQTTLYQYLNDSTK